MNVQMYTDFLYGGREGDEVGGYMDVMIPSCEIDRLYYVHVEHRISPLSWNTL